MSSIIKQDRSYESLEWSPFQLASISTNQVAQRDATLTQARCDQPHRECETSSHLAERERQIEQACEQRLRETVEQQVQDDTEHAIRSLGALATQVEESHRQWHASAEKRIVQIALAVAQRILRDQVQGRPEIPLRLVREAVDLAGSNGPLRVALHPDDHPMLQDEVLQSIDPIKRQGPVEVVADASVSRGGCRVETTYGTIDQTFEAQLERIREELDEG